MDKVAVIILSAGLGTRMKSKDAKVLHRIDDKEMILYVVETAKKVVGNNIVVVVGYQAEKVKKVVSVRHEVYFATQEQQLGTGHAVKIAIPFVPDIVDDVIVLCGDVPLVEAKTLKNAINEHRKKNRHITVLAVELKEPTGYGRIVFDENKRVTKIVEEADASESQKKIKLVNTGIYCFEKKFLIDAITKLKSDNSQHEIYLTDIVEVGYRENKRIGGIIGEKPEEFTGVNSVEELKKIESFIKLRRHKP